MLRCLRLVLTAAVTIAVTALGPPAASAAPADVAQGNLSAATCAFPTVKFKGKAYCPGTIGGVQATKYGIGTLVVLNDVTVTEVTTTTVTVAAYEYKPCPPDKLCGAGSFVFVTLKVSWSGTNRPVYGDVLNLFGKTKAASFTVKGYIKLRNCPIDLCF